MTAAPQRILLLQLHHLGDVLLTTPAIRAARAHCPDAQIDFVTNALGAQALHGSPHLNSVLVKPRLWSINRTRYDAVVDLHSVPRTARVVAASRARTRIGLRGRGPRNLAYTQLLPREPGAVYMALQKLRMLAPLGVNADNADLSLQLAISDADRGFAAALFEMQGLADRPVVALSPVAKHAFKQWGAANWALVGDALAALGAGVLITSGPGEREHARKVAEQMRNSAVWDYGETTITQLAALYERCAFWLGNDGGPKHIAAAAKTPTLAVYRRQLGAVWSDLRPGSLQHAINAEADDVKALKPKPVIDRASELFMQYRNS